MGLVMLVLSNTIPIAVREHVVVLFIPMSDVPDVVLLRTNLSYGRITPMIVVTSQWVVQQVLVLHVLLTLV